MKKRWVEIVGEMAELDNANAVQCDDIEAELTLRGIEPPGEAVDMERAMANMVADHDAYIAQNHKPGLIQHTIG